MGDLKYLEVQRLIRELQFLESDYIYQSEVIRLNNILFLNSVEDVVSKFPDLKSINDSRQINIHDQEVTLIDKKENTKEFSLDKKIKSVYREIVKITHPDKVDNYKLNNVYLDAIKSYESGDIVGIYKISVDLSIDFDWTENEILEIVNNINDLKLKIELIKSSYTYKWIKSDSKNKVVIDYIKSNYLNYINSDSPLV